MCPPYSNVGTMARTEIYRLRLTERERATLDAAQEAGGFKSLAAFIRHAAERAIAQSEQPQRQSGQSQRDHP